MSGRSLAYAKSARKPYSSLWRLLKAEYGGGMCCGDTGMPVSHTCLESQTCPGTRQETTSIRAARTIHTHSHALVLRFAHTDPARVPPSSLVIHDIVSHRQCNSVIHISGSDSFPASVRGWRERDQETSWRATFVLCQHASVPERITRSLVPSELIIHA